MIAKSELRARNAAARKTLSGISPQQLDEIGTMLGMSNFGCDRKDRPEVLAESEEMYEGFMEEINSWRKRLRSKRETWGWCEDLAEMAAEAIRRCPVHQARHH